MVKEQGDKNFEFRGYLCITGKTQMHIHVYSSLHYFQWQTMVSNWRHIYVLLCKTRIRTYHTPFHVIFISYFTSEQKLYQKLPAMRTQTKILSSHTCVTMFIISWYLIIYYLNSENYTKALFTRYKLTRVRPGLKLTRVSFCRVNTANPGSTRVSLSCKHY